MRILALEPYYGGSHRAFLDGWRDASRHEWTVLTLPARKWKWRMRHAAVTFADGLKETAREQHWDVLLCSDMLNLAELRGLAPPAVARLPCVAYFHENQFTYPFRHASERDYHYGFINMTTALAADGVWFNSAFHRDAFLAALRDVLRQMPDHAPLSAVERIAAKASVEPPGIHAPAGRRDPPEPGPMRILWAARWEHDKNPDTFFDALRRLRDSGAAFRVSVVGEQFRDRPPVFDAAREEFAERIDRWGYQSRGDYEAALREADVFVSTAEHEFFGLAAAEAIAAGAFPLLPRRLAYPELAARIVGCDTADFLYDGDAASLARRLGELAARLSRAALWPGDPACGAAAMRALDWSRRGGELDRAIQTVAFER